MAKALAAKGYHYQFLLARNAGRVLTHAQLLTAIWGPAHVHDVQYLRVYVGQLRQKLGAPGSLIVTEPGVGYRLLDTVDDGQRRCRGRCGHQ